MENDRIAEIQKDLRKFKEFGGTKTLKLLKYLKSQNLTKDQIKTSKISQTVTSISKHVPNPDQEDDKEMVQEAQSLIQAWKKLFTQSQQKQNKQIQQKKKQIKKISLDDIDLSKLVLDLSPPIRNKAYKSVYQFLMTAQLESITHETIEPLSKNIEKAIWSNNHKNNPDLQIVERNYGQDMTKLIKNIKNSEKFKIEIIKGKYTIDQIGKMDPKLFYTDAQKAELQRLKDEIEAQNDPDFFKKKKQEFQKNASQGEECEKCKGTKAYCVNEVQIRGADEPMTRFMRCDECDHNWQD